MIIFRPGERTEGLDRVQHTARREVDEHLRVDVRVRERPCAALSVGRDKIRAARPLPERAAIGIVEVVCRRAAHAVDKILPAQAAARDQILTRQALAAVKIIAVDGAIRRAIIPRALHDKAEKAVVPVALPADRRADGRGFRVHHILLFLRKRAEAVGDLGVERGGHRRFRHELRHMIRIVHRAAGRVAEVALLCVKLFDELVAVGGRIIGQVILFAAGGEIQKKQRCKQDGKKFFHTISPLRSKGLLLCHYSGFSKKRNAFPAPPRPPIDRNAGRIYNVCTFDQQEFLCTIIHKPK